MKYQIYDKVLPWHDILERLLFIRDNGFNDPTDQNFVLEVLRQCQRKAEFEGATRVRIDHDHFVCEFGDSSGKGPKPFSPKSLNRGKRKPDAAVRSHVNEALRNAIHEQVAPFQGKGYEAHHVIPFEELRDGWTNELGLSYQQIYVQKMPSKFGGLTWCMSDADQKESWQQYHLEHGEIKKLPKSEHAAVTYKNNERGKASTG